jgi:uncharacterized ubiquitin-like protein YukD
MWWVQVLSALLAPLIVAIAVYVARQQRRAAHTNFRRDYYDRRLPIYRAAMTLVAKAMTKGTVSNEDLHGFSVKTTEARFFYNDEIAKFLEEMQQQALDLQICHKMMKEAPTESERQHYADGWSKRAKWFTDLPNEINDKFSPFLSRESNGG